MTCQLQFLIHSAFETPIRFSHGTPLRFAQLRSPILAQRSGKNSFPKKAHAYSHNRVTSRAGQRHGVRKMTDPGLATDFIATPSSTTYSGEDELCASDDQDHR